MFKWYVVCDSLVEVPNYIQKNQMHSMTVDIK